MFFQQPPRANPTAPAELRCPFQGLRSAWRIPESVKWKGEKVEMKTPENEGPTSSYFCHVLQLGVCVLSLLCQQGAWVQPPTQGVPYK